jgi:hypothetical protein
MIVWLMLTAGQWPLRRVNVICDDFLFLLNAAFAIAMMDLISHVHLPSFVLYIYIIYIFTVY